MPLVAPPVAPEQGASAGMGQIVLGSGAAQLQAVLGSCVGVALYHPRLRIAALAHVVLPEAAGRPGSPGKFADTAIPEMLDLLAQAGAPASGLVAKLAGGASMFGKGGPMQVGDSNIAAVRQALEAARVRILAEHLAGNKGRKVKLSCATGQYLVEVLGQPPEML